MAANNWRRLGAEYIGTVFLLATVVGSGIMAHSLSNGNDALALLGNTLPTGAILVVLILVLGPVSGAHFNPAVTFVFVLRGDLTLHLGTLYVLAQFSGAVFGVVLAHQMFELSSVSSFVSPRTGIGQYLSEAVATFGLVATIIGTSRHGITVVASAVGLYVSAAYWFTASTSFANPAVTLARGFTSTFSGIRLEDVPIFILAQCLGAALAYFAMTSLLKDSGSSAVT